jgi:4-amino-4-deoxy-L-arabinose transferase-like glycosyltransferase
VTAPHKLSHPFAQRLLALLFIFALAFAVRSLTANFLRAHFDDPGWFQFGSYSVFDRQARDILDHKEPMFWINDSSRTDQMIYPPGYPLWMAAIYATGGDRSPVAVQRVQLVLDSFAVLLLVGIGATAFRWSVGVTAGVLGALSPLLALAGATPNADAPTSWIVLGGVWLLLLAAKRQTIKHAIAAGALLGLACWLRVNPLLMFIAWAVALLLFVKASWRRRLGLSAVLALATLIVIAPVVVRNLTVFYPQVAPTGLGIGWNLWAGIGETDRGSEFGAPCCDEQVIEQDRRAMGLPAETPVGLFWPDGIRRDRERGQKALAVIKAHPVWYTGTMARRLWGHLKFAGAPVPHVGSQGFNVTSSKCLPLEHQGGVPAFVVNALGMIQSVWRYLALPLMIFGIGLSFRKDWRTTAVLLATVGYYLATLAVGHSEIRYGAPMQALLIVFAAVAVCSLGAIAGGSGFWKRASWFRLPALTMTSSSRARKRRRHA